MIAPVNPYKKPDDRLFYVLAPGIDLVNDCCTNQQTIKQTERRHIFSGRETMEIPSSATYELDNGSISIFRRYGAGEGPVEFLFPAVRFFPVPLYYYNNEQVVSHTLF